MKLDAQLNLNQPKPTIVLVDPLWDGHHSTYFKIFAETFLKLNCSVIALCPNPEEMYQWISSNTSIASEQANLFKAFKFKETASIKLPVKPLRKALSSTLRWRSVAQAVRDVSEKLGKKPDLVFFAWIDWFLGNYLTHHVVDRLFPYPWSGLYLQPYHLRMQKKFAYLRRGPLNDHAVLKSPNCRSVVVMDKAIAQKLQIDLKDKSVIFSPDITDLSPPSPDFDLAKQIKERAKNRKIVGLLGSQGKRKGFLTMLEVSQNMKEQDFFFVFAGQPGYESFSPSQLKRICEIIGSSPENCFFHIQSIPDGSQFNALVDVCNIVFVVYERYPFVSNILTKAAFFKKSVIASETFFIGETTQAYHLGITVPEGNVERCVEALHDISQSSKFDRQKYEQGCEQYNHSVSPEQFSRSIQEILNAI